MITVSDNHGSKFEVYRQVKDLFLCIRHCDDVTFCDVIFSLKIAISALVTSIFMFSR